MVSDMSTGKSLVTLDDLHSFAVKMPTYHGLSLLVESSTEDTGDG
jgi:hypothetical protein